MLIDYYLQKHTGVTVAIIADKHKLFLIKICLPDKDVNFQIVHGRCVFF